MTKNISPHVSIYKFPVTAISSISTRVSGVYLTGLFIATGISKLTNTDTYFYNKYKNLDNNIQSLFHYSLITPTIYHTFGGIRHFIWDKYPKLLTTKSVAKSSYLIFGLSAITSVLSENIIKKQI